MNHAGSSRYKVAASRIYEQGAKSIRVAGVDSSLRFDMHIDLYAVARI
jgi:hypothetical protein